MSQFGAGTGATRLVLTAEQQTKRSWAKLVTSFSEAPEIFRNSFERLTRDATRFPYTILVPSHTSFLTREKEKLVFCLGDSVIVLEQIRGNPTCTCYGVEDVRYIQVGRALLQSWVKIRGVTSDGALTSSEFRFNTVTDYLFTPIVERMRHAANCSAGLDSSQERSKFDYLNHLNFKLMNYARHSILPGEKIVQSILQPEIRTQALVLFGKIFFRTLCSSHLYILTDKELVLVQDGVGNRWGRDLRYGGIWQYVPLDKIISISLAEARNGVFTMSIQLLGDDRIDSLFSVSNREEINLIKSRLGTTR